MRLVRLCVLLGVLGCAVTGSAPSVSPVIFAAAVQQPAPGKPVPQDEFVPIDQLPPQEELPAAPMVVAAYSFIWIAFVAYCISLVKRVRKVETDLAAIEKGRR
jgi:hypothetical protein